MIKPKPHKCKGINKAKGVPGCGKESLNRKFGLCPSCLWDWSQENDNGKIWYQSQFLPKVKKVTEREKKKKNRQAREDLKSIQRLINDARVPFQRWIRLRDINKSCISCGSTTSEIWDAGHYKKAEVYTGLIFNENNVHKQCRKCNGFLGGNEANYRVGLEKRIGTEALKEIEDKADSLRQHKFEREELIDIKKHYQKLLKDIR